MVHLFATLPLSVSNCQLVGFFEISSSLCCWCAATLSKCCGWSFYLHPSYGLHAMHIAVNIQTPCSVSTSEIATETSNLPELHSRFPGLGCRSTNYVKDLKDANHQCGVPVLTQFALAARAGCERSCQPKTCSVMSKCSAKATNWVKACWNTEATRNTWHASWDARKSNMCVFDSCTSFHFWELLEMSFASERSILQKKTIEEYRRPK